MRLVRSVCLAPLDARLPGAVLSRVLVLVLAVLPVGARQEPPGPEAPSEELVERTLEGLERAFGREGEVADRVEALRAAAQVADARVVKAVARGLKADEPEVQKAALESLRFQAHPDALEALHACYRRDRALVKDPERAPLLFRAIGEHGAEASIEVLADDLYSIPDETIAEARILALGNVRSARSAEELMDLMNRAGRRRLQALMPSFRLALNRLTGADGGTTLEGWQRWWNEVDGRPVVPAEPPRMRPDDLVRWDRFWGRETPERRATRRGRRGDDE